MEKKIDKVERRIVEEVVSYIAYDGETFKSEEECIKYESSAKAAIEQAFYKLMINGEPFFESDIWENYGYGSEEFLVAIIDIKDANDLEIANRYYAFHKTNKEMLMGSEYIGKRVLVNIGYCYDVIKSINPNPRTEKELIEEFKNEMSTFFNPKSQEEK